MLRLAQPTDTDAILEIYAPYIRNTSLTFELETPSPADFARRIDNYLQYAPWLVIESEGRVAGYAYASRYRERAGYQWSVECSIYMHDEFMGKGLAEPLYRALFDLLTLQGFRNVYAVINLPNERSVRFHENLGFRYQFTFEKVGYKLGKWKNVGWWMLQVNEYTDEPNPIIPFTSLAGDDRVQSILQKYS